MSIVDIFPSADRINAHIFASAANERLAQAKAVLSLSAKSPILVSAAADIVGSVIADVIFSDRASLGDEAISTISNRLTKAHTLLIALSEEEDVGQEEVDLVCHASRDFIEQATDSINALCN